MKQIVETAGAPFGSMYHFFPNGKEELGAETIRWSGAIYGQLIDLFYEPGDDPVVATRRFFEGAADTLRDTDYADACPIATVALEVASTSEPLRQATADVFESWLSNLTGRFAELGLTKTQARNLSVSLFCLLEGAFILARAHATTRTSVPPVEPRREAVRVAFDSRSTQLDGEKAPMTSVGVENRVRRSKPSASMLPATSPAL